MVAMPTVTPLPPPPPPTVYVTPGEVTEANHAEKVRRLLDETEADRKALASLLYYLYGKLAACPPQPPPRKPGGSYD